MGEAEAVAVDPEVPSEATPETEPVAAVETAPEEPEREFHSTGVDATNKARVLFGLAPRDAKGQFASSGKGEDGALTPSTPSTAQTPTEPAPAAGEVPGFTLDGKEYKPGDVLYQVGRTKIIYGERYKTPEAAMDAIEREALRREEQSRHDRMTAGAAPSETPTKPAAPAPEVAQLMDPSQTAEFKALAGQLGEEGAAALVKLVQGVAFNGLNVGLQNFRQKELAPLEERLQGPAQLAEDAKATAEYSQTAYGFEEMLNDSAVPVADELRGVKAEEVFEVLRFMDQNVPGFRKMGDEARYALVVPQLRINRLTRQAEPAAPQNGAAPVTRGAARSAAGVTPPAATSGPRSARGVPARRLAPMPNTTELMGFK